MCGKKSLVLFAAVLLLAGGPLARAGDITGSDRDGGSNEHQIELDEQFARSHQTTMPGTPARPLSAYGYAARHRPAAKHRHGINR
jgi:hypothetical protein